MDNSSKLFKNKSTLNLYAKIQKNLSKLKPNSCDEEIQAIFNIIPSTFYDEKQNLIVLCQLFGMIGRYRRQMGRITIQLFQNIMNYIQKYLQNESSLFWNIFGSCFYFKYWMYKEGLIDIEQIILSSQSDKTSLTASYFFPEIIEHNPEFFFKDIKFRFQCFQSESSYSTDKIELLRKLREKHLTWLKKSGDYHNELYKEIEKDQLRLSIKTDDISTFQRILSQSNLPIDSFISESVIEHFLNIQFNMRLIDYAANYCSYKIFKFLLLNGAKIEPSLMNFVIHSDSYEMFHQIESKIGWVFDSIGLLFAIISWNSDFIKYIIENYGYDYLLDNEDEEEESKENNDNESKENNDNESKENNDNESKENNDNESKENNDNEAKENNDNEAKENNDNEAKENNDNESKENNDNESKENNDNESKENNDNEAKENNDNESKENNDNEAKENNDNEANDNETKEGNDNKVNEANDSETNDIGSKEEDTDNAVVTKNQKKKNLLIDDFFEFKERQIINMIDNAIYSYNFSFFKTIILPILRINPEIIAFNYQTVVMSSINDMSFYFPNEFCHFPVFANFLFTEEINSLLKNAIDKNYTDAVEYFIKYPLVDINELMLYACSNYANTKVIKILSTHQNFDVNYRNRASGNNAFQISMVKDNVYALKFLIENYPDMEMEDYFEEVHYCIKSKRLMTLKFFIKFLMIKNSDEKFIQIINSYKKRFIQINLYESFENCLTEIIDEIKNK
ncbi:hypothetical protein M9Y10_036052 [Tritrichomonas musculus]|uniref:DUF3447 domain-containing protein n=1 Tax=Tritrichomonas musculus TaxID=1915356 RepID=A0ABR2GXY1_9EUKA